MQLLKKAVKDVLYPLTKWSMCWFKVHANNSSLEYHYVHYTQKVSKLMYTLANTAVQHIRRTIIHLSPSVCTILHSTE